MFIPIGDRPNLPQTPWVTWSLIAVNVMVHLALVPLAFRAPSPGDPVFAHYVEVLTTERGPLPAGLRVSEADLVRFEYGVKPRFFTVGDAVTSMFLHGGWLHLAGNMLFLWIFGDNVEHRLGQGRFVLAYLGTGIVAALGDSILRWGSGIPSVGASGAISGVLGLYFVWFPHNRVRVWVFLFPFFADVIELSARVVLLFYLVVENLLPVLFAGAGGGGVSHGAHLGGFLGGWALARGLGEGRGRAKAVPRAGERVPPQRLRSRFRAALGAGRLDEAAALLFQSPRASTRAELEAGDKIDLGEALEGLGALPAALGAFQRALADHPNGPGRARAHLGAARVLLAGLGTPTGAYQHLYAVVEEEPTPEEEEEARRLVGEIARTVRGLPRDVVGPSSS